MAENVTIASAMSSGTETAAVIPHTDASGILSTFLLAVWGTAPIGALQISPDGGTTWIEYPGGAFTANMIAPDIRVGAYMQVRIARTSGTINATLTKVY